MAHPRIFYKEQELKTGELKIDWSFGNEVDFWVDYLHPDFQRGDKPCPDLESVKNFLRAVYKAQGNSNRGLNIKLVGGEPTRFGDFNALGSELKMSGAGFSIHSTGYREIEWWEKNAIWLDEIKFDWHPRHVSYDHLKQVLQTTKGSRREVNVWMDPEDFDYCLSCHDTLKSEMKVPTHKRIVFKDTNRTPEDYTDDQKELLREKQKKSDFILQYEDWSWEYLTENEMKLDRIKNFMGWYCKAGVTQLVIDSSGDIYRGWCGMGGKLGNISDEDLELPTEAIMCGKTGCHNGFDLNAVKYLGEEWDPDEIPGLKEINE